MKGNVDDFGLWDILSVVFMDFFVLVVEFVEYREVWYIYSLEFFCYCLFYEEVMYLVEEGKIYFRVLR